MTPESFLKCIQSFSFQYQIQHSDESNGNSLIHTYHLYHCVKKLYPRADIRVSPAIVISTHHKQIFPQSLVIWVNGERYHDANYQTWRLYNKYYYECLSEVPKEFQQHITKDMSELFYEYVNLATHINNGKVLEESPYYIDLAMFCKKSFNLLNKSSLL